MPMLADSKKRVEYSFATEAAGQRWIDEQLARRAEGLEPEKPANRGVAPLRAVGPDGEPLPLPRFADLARAWHREWYEEMHNAGPDRSVEAWRDIELHLLPNFAYLLDTDLETGRAMVKDWLRTMSGRKALSDDSAFRPGRKRYARETAGGFLWLLRSMLAFGRTLGFDIPPYAEGKGIHALHPVGRPKRRKAPLVSVATTAEIAGQLHVIHQLVLWLLRLCGLRISESYGLLVGDFFCDAEGDGFLLAAAQGGRTFRQRTDADEVEVTSRKEAGKTDSAYRLIALPRPLTALISTVIEIFHSDAEGRIDTSARLIPPIRAKDGGQVGFRNALRVAAASLGQSAVEDTFIAPHDLRKSFATDLAWSAEVSGLVARRAMGHRVGSDVFDLVYTLDSRLKEHLAPVARQVEREIETAGLTTLMVPTVRRPAYGNVPDPEHLAVIDVELASIGWQIRDRAGLLGVRDVAGLLHMDLGATRRLFPSKIPGVKVGGEWRCREADALAFAERLAGCRMLVDVATAGCVDYHTAYRTMKRLGIDPKTDDHSRTLMLLSDDAALILAELDRLDRLRARSVKVAQAAAMLRTSESMVHYWARAGRLAYDAESDGSGSKFVTRISIESKRADRLGRGRPRVLLADFLAATGFSESQVAALVAARLLVRARRDGLTPESVYSWAAGHRPDLLASPLLYLRGFDHPPTAARDAACLDSHGRLTIVDAPSLQ
ncbi:MAG TPA: hypothetical protein VHB02_18375 [Acidimicrobiales bacterium]|nr:hypothetical protein [Acidimicrobiales bacterium]